MANKNDSGRQLFADKGAEKLYEAVVSKARAKIGEKGFALDPKQTCVHVTAGKDGIAYAGLHPRKNALLLNIRLHEPLKSKRVRKVEQISKNRYDCEVILSFESDVDAEIVGWLQDAYRAASQPKREAKLDFTQNALRIVEQAIGGKLVAPKKSSRR